MPDYTAGPRAKIERAKEHIEQFSSEWSHSLRHVEPYRYFAEDERETGDLVYRVVIDEKTPAILQHLGLVIGDAIHNLRSALDLLACQMVIENGGTPTRFTYFPIADSRKEFETGGPKKVKGASEDAIKLLREIRPYKGGNIPLYRLHRLDIADKHRLLLTVGSAHESTRVSMRIGDWESGSIRLSPGPKIFPLKDNGEIYRVPVEYRQAAEKQPQPEFFFEIAFGDGEIVKGEPVFETLYALLGEVEQIVESYDALFWGDIPF